MKTGYNRWSFLSLLEQGFIQVAPHGDNSISDPTPDLDLDLTESASDDFEVGNTLSPEEDQEGTSDEEWRRTDFTEQMMKYTQHKPKKTKDVTSRESALSVCVCA